MFVLFTLAAALAGGAESPSALHHELSAALSGGEPWRLVDYVLPEDRAMIAVSFATMGSMTASDPTAQAELQAILDRYAVKALPDAFTSAEFEAAVTVAYADVVDYHGLSQELWAFLTAHGSSPGDVVLPKLRGAGSPAPYLKIDKQKLPLVLREGRWYIDTPDPASAKG